MSAHSSLFRRLPWAVLAASLLLLSGCANRPGYNPRDPFEPFNRTMTDFNEGVDAVVLRPVATAYREGVPPLMRTGVSNFFGNLGDAWSAINSLLQFKFQNAAENWMRLSVNTVFGLGGILDIASDLNIERHREDFGQTLGRWGIPAGPYLVLPLLGSSTVRDAVALPIDRRADPVRLVSPSGERNGLYGLRLVDTRSNLLRASAVLDQAALDKYSFTRDAHLQRRRAEIFDGNAPDAPAGQPGGAAEAAPPAQPAPASEPAGAPTPAAAQ